MLTCDYGGNVTCLAFSQGHMGLLAIGGDATNQGKVVMLYDAKRDVVVGTFSNFGHPAHTVSLSSQVRGEE